MLLDTYTISERKMKKKYKYYRIYDMIKKKDRKK